MEPELELADLARRIADGEAATRTRTSLIGALAAAGWTQARIATAAGISQQAVSTAINRTSSQALLRIAIRKEIAAGTNPRDSLARWKARTPADPESAAHLATYLADFEAIIAEEEAL